MKETKYSKTYFRHLTFYCEPHSFIFPISVIVDTNGIVLCFAFFGLVWSWKRD